MKLLKRSLGGTGIPVQKMLKEQAQKLLDMEDEMRKQVVGQDTA